MRTLYREKRWFCGDYLEVDIYPVFKMQTGRSRRGKPTSEVQAKLNDHNAERKLVRLLNANFTRDDYEIHFTYTDGNLPENDTQAKKDIQNFLRRARRLYKAAGAELKYVAVTEGGIGGTRYHHHVTMSGEVNRCELEALWGYGYVNSRRLQFNEYGVEGLAMYITKQFRTHRDELLFKKRWSCSRNLIRPEPKERDGKLSYRRVRDLATIESGSRESFEKLYEGYTFAACRPFYNDMNGGYYITVLMYRTGIKFSNTRKRERMRS